jgi:hypothetical protein
MFARFSVKPSLDALTHSLRKNREKCTHIAHGKILRTDIQFEFDLDSINLTQTGAAERRIILSKPFHHGHDGWAPRAINSIYYSLPIALHIFKAKPISTYLSPSSKQDRCEIKDIQINR